MTPRNVLDVVALASISGSLHIMAGRTDVPGWRQVDEAVWAGYLIFGAKDAAKFQGRTVFEYRITDEGRDALKEQCP